MPGQKSPVVLGIDPSKLPGKSINGSKVPVLLTKFLAVVSFKHSFAAENVNAPPEVPVKMQAICKHDFLQCEKEDAVDWEFWLTPEVLSGEGPPPFG